MSITFFDKHYSVPGRRPRHLRWVRALVPALVLLPMTAAYSQATYFELGATDTNSFVAPAGIALDSSGDMFGACSLGGKYDQGYVWELGTNGVLTDLYDFGGITIGTTGLNWDGAVPRATVTLDSSGNLYGTCALGGAYFLGTAWEIAKSGGYKILHNFGGNLTVSGITKTDGSSPMAGVTLDSAGDIFGTTSAGGANGGGMVWTISKAGQYTDAHDFGGMITKSGASISDGRTPLGGITLDSSGNLYGTTSLGGANAPIGASKGAGILWELSSSLATYTDLHDFGGKITTAGGASGEDGVEPTGAVTFDKSGNMYGVTINGGANKESSVGFGMLWRYGTNGAYADLHDFGGIIENSNGNIGVDGGFPTGQVSFDSSGNMYGTATSGGANLAFGIVWERTSVGTYVDLHDFGVGKTWSTYDLSSKDGAFPNGQVLVDSKGNLYGTCLEGGVSVGVGWTICKATLTKVVVSPTSVVGGANVTATVTAASAAPVGGFQVNVEGQYFGNFAIILPGATTGSIALQTVPVYSQTVETITAQLGSASVTTTLTVNPATLSSVTLNPSTVVGGATSTGTVTLTGPSTGQYVNVSSSNTGLAYPSTNSVYVNYGSTTATFTVYTAPVSANTSATITASVGTTTKTAKLTINK